MALAKELAKRPNLALQACKLAIDQAFELAEDEAIEQILSLMERAFSSHDGQEGVRAFLPRKNQNSNTHEGANWLCAWD
jgi:enoyl-CoA hydratase/carnithine racemase